MLSFFLAGEKLTPFCPSKRVHKFVFRKYLPIHSCLQKSTFFIILSTKLSLDIFPLWVISVACNALKEHRETTGSVLSAAQMLLLPFSAAAFPAERACSQTVTAFSEAEMEKPKMNQRDGEACL